MKKPYFDEIDRAVAHDYYNSFIAVRIRATLKLNKWIKNMKLKTGK